ncbi:MAG: SagB/ThcOx family dehydrogenase [Brevinematales bacterium]|nr:SagB/ThcOx family dehydrogenase [Brevinematales bacterium]
MNKIKVLLLILSNISFCYEREILLPEIDKNGFLEKIIQNRRSIRDYSDKPISLKELSYILWAAQGITSKEGFRTTPSAGALYPVEIYIVVNKVEKLETGIYKFNPQKKSLLKISTKNIITNIYEAALRQDCIIKAPAIIAIGAVFDRVTAKYGARGTNYTYIEVGCVAQNIHLMVENLNLGTVVVGAFYDTEIKKLLEMQKNETPIILMPIGHRKTK